MKRKLLGALLMLPLISLTIFAACTYRVFGILIVMFLVTGAAMYGCYLIIGGDNE